MATETAVKARPIMFSAPMVRAILDGRKTTTRRVVKPQPKADIGGFVLCDDGRTWMDYPSYVVNPSNLDLNGEWTCPYGAPGERLWVRETWCPYTGHGALMRGVRVSNGSCSVMWRANMKDEFVAPWRSPIHMPRWASRITLEITDVRCERLQDISITDMTFEGLTDSDGCSVSNYDRDAALPFWISLWDSLNGKTYPWASNPWVWVVAFKRVEAK